MNNIIKLGNISIAYIEVNENAPQTIFFIHGNSGSSQTWQYQLESNSLSSYRLIAIDLPGHGHSSPAKLPSDTYSPIGTSKLIAAIIGQLHNNKPFIVVGFSYGTNLIAEVIHDGLLPQGIMLISSCCVGEGYGIDKIFKEIDRPNIFFYNESQEDVVRDFFNEVTNTPTAIDFLPIDYLKTDKEFKPAFLKAVEEGKIRDEIAALKSTEVNTCVVFGVNDFMVHADYLDAASLNVWMGKTFKLGGAGHFVHLEKPKEVNSLLAEFAGSTFTSIPS